MNELIKAMDKSVHCLALSVHEDVHEHVSKTWQTLRESIVTPHTDDTQAKALDWLFDTLFTQCNAVVARSVRNEMEQRLKGLK